MSTTIKFPYKQDQKADITETNVSVTASGLFTALKWEIKTDNAHLTRSFPRAIVFQLG